MASTLYCSKMPVSQMGLAPPVASSAGWKTSRIFRADRFRQLQKNRRMAVVAAGVHPARMLRRISRAGFFFNGQGVQIRPEGDGAPGAKIEPGAQAPLRGRKQAAAQTLQFPPQIGDGQGKLAVQLGDPVQCPAVFDDPNGKCPLSVDECFSIIDDVGECVNLYLAFL